MTQFNHVTVLLHEAVDGLNIKPAGMLTGLLAEAATVKQF